MTDTTKEAIRDTSGRKVSSKSDCRREYEAKEPMSPAKILSNGHFTFPSPFYL
ncbi:MAG: hypothetical protein WA220_07995 [Candidatus Nitrosopolaris sp.]